MLGGVENQDDVGKGIVSYGRDSSRSAILWETDNTAAANLSFDKYLSQSGVKYTYLGHFQANFFGNYKYDTTFYKYDTSYRYSYDNFAAESKRCGRDSIHHVPPHTKKTTRMAQGRD